MSNKMRADVVIEAIRIDRTGNLEWARGYLRRGPTYSDIVMLSRKELIALGLDGKRLVGGRRLERYATTFTHIQPIHLLTVTGKYYFSDNLKPEARDHLPAIPIL